MRRALPSLNRLAKLGKGRETEVKCASGKEVELLASLRYAHAVAHVVDTGFNLLKKKIDHLLKGLRTDFVPQLSNAIPVDHDPLSLLHRFCAVFVQIRLTSDRKRTKFETSHILRSLYANVDSRQVKGVQVRLATRTEARQESDQKIPLRILVVDDSRLQRRIVGTHLRQWGFIVQEAENGAEALAACRRAPPDIILSDWIMPGMSGIDFCRAFRAMQRPNYGYFILLTSKSSKEEIAVGLDAGADDFLTKPVNPAELRARLAAGHRILEMERELTEKNRLIKSTLDELQVLYDSLDSDLLEAKKLQQSLLSERYRDFGVADLSLALHSAGHVGGDLVGTYPISEGRIGLYGIDVSGHGVSSALMTARLASYLSATVPEQNLALEQIVPGRFAARAPGETLARLNHIIMSDLDTDHYFTIALADVDLVGGRVLLAQAGHPHPVVQRHDGRVEFVGCGGLPVGLIGDASFEEVSFALSPGDRLLIYSDGLTECAAPDGTLLDEGGLARLMTDLRQTRGPAFLESLMWKLADHAQDGDFQDDVSAILLEFKDCPGLA